MSTFTIDPDNNITALAEVSADVHPAHAFSSEKELLQLTADWPMARLVDAWNSFAGAAPFDDLKPVKKFTSRTVAVGRIWEAVGRLAAHAGEPTRQVAPTPKRRNKAAGTAGRRGRAQRGAKLSRGNKKAEVIALLRRSKGATLGQIEAATSWQKHTIRGLVSVLGNKGGMNIESWKSASGERTYRILR